VYEPSGTRPLAVFHDALANLRQGTDSDGKVRVLVYGASGTAADRWTGYLRAYLQTRFGDGGPGFVPLGRHSKWSRHQEYAIESSSDWIKHQTGRKTASAGGWYGLAGVALAASKTGAHALISPAKSSSSSHAVSSFELWYLEQPEGGTASVFVNGRPFVELDSSAKLVRAAYEHIGLTAGAHSVELRTTNDLEVRTFGVVAESDGPGVVVDTLGVIGAHASAMLQWDEALWAEHLQRRDPDLFLFAFGTNEAFSETFDEERFRRQYGDALGRIRRAVPEASCLLMAPGDHGKAGEYAPTDANLDTVRRAELELADEHGCALWNAYEFMNGRGGMEAWVTAEPPLAASDYVHTTSRGAVMIAMAVADALVWGYDATHSVTD
jgi:lysophospholipase L1-like esterase